LEKLADVELQRDSSARLLRQQTAIISRLQHERSTPQSGGGKRSFSYWLITRTPRTIKRMIPRRIKQFIKSRMVDSLNAE
jgi:hypothetical protein